MLVSGCSGVLERSFPSLLEEPGGCTCLVLPRFADSLLFAGWCALGTQGSLCSKGGKSNLGKEVFGVLFIKALLSVISGPNLSPKPKQHKATKALLT